MTTETTETPIDHGRGVSPISGMAFGRLRPRFVTLGALALGAGLILLAPLMFGSAPADAPQEGPARQVVRFDPMASNRAPPQGEEDGDVRELAEPEAADSGLSGETFDEPQFAPATSAETPPEPPPAPPPSPLLVYSADPSPPTAAVRSMPAQDASKEADTLGAPRTLSAHRLDRRYALLAGATLPCVLLTAIDSTTPGLVTCSLTRDVLSEDGAVVLLEKGSRVVGAYDEGLALGERRLFVVWTRVVTPKGVAIALQSPAADALGRAGIDGVLEGRFWSRFGGALLLSLVDTGGEAVLDPQSGRTLLRPTSPALEETAKIGPRLSVPQGREITIFVANDLDFRDVYALALR